jgi:hypothetical protein
VPAAGEELDPVVRHRVVRGGQHHTQVGVGLGDQPGDRRRGQHPGVLDVDPGAGQPRGHGCSQELAGGARVASDHCPRARRSHPVAGLVHERADLAEHVRRSHREVDGQLGRQVAVGQSSDAVGAEESSHGSSEALGCSRCPDEAVPYRLLY